MKQFILMGMLLSLSLTSCKPDDEVCIDTIIDYYDEHSNYLYSVRDLECESYRNN